MALPYTYNNIIMITLATLKNVGWATTHRALHLSHLSAAEQEGSSQEKMIMKLTKKLMPTFSWLHRQSSIRSPLNIL
jgi:hypothetical protein